jgi:hypothetical protein
MLEKVTKEITSEDLAIKAVDELSRLETVEEQLDFVNALIIMTYDAGIQSAQNYDCFGCEEIESCSYSYESETCPQK